MSCTRVEFTLLDDRFFREKVIWHEGKRPRLVHSVLFEDAVEPPFPLEGKEGLAVYVGPLESFAEPRVRLLWELEKRRGRMCMVVLTSLRGRNFVRNLRTLETHLGDSQIFPACFLRRRGRVWDSLDSFSSGESESVKGAHIRIRRIKQTCWEWVVDRLSMVDDSIREDYFRELFIERPRLLEASYRLSAEGKCSPVIGIAGECLKGGNLFSLLSQDIIAEFSEAAPRSQPPEAGTWTYLGKRHKGRELLLWSDGSRKLKPGEVLYSAGEGRPGELAIPGELTVTELKQVLTLGEEHGVVCRIAADWRYPPGREMATAWRQKSALSAGADHTHG